MLVIGGCRKQLSGDWLPNLGAGYYSEAAARINTRTERQKSMDMWRHHNFFSKSS